MNTFKEFINANEDNKVSREVSLTNEQEQMIERLSEILGISFEDTVMALVQAQFSDMGHAYLQRMAKMN